MNQLPSEILTSIIEHIDERTDLLTCSLVNRCFYTATVPWLWRFCAEESDPEDLLMCLKAGHPMGTYLRELELHSAWTDTQLLALMPLVSPQLDDIYFANGEHISDTSFQHIAEYWPNLTALQGRYLTVTQTSMDAIGPHLRLRILNLCYSPNLSAHTYAAFKRSPLDSVTVKSPVVWTTQTVLDLAEFPLTYFRLAIQHEITHTLLGLHPWPQLTHLVLENMVDIHPDYIIAFIHTHPCLEHVDFENSMCITNQVLDAMADLPLLDYVQLSGCQRISGRGVRRLIRQSWHLEFIGLDNTGIVLLEFDELIHPSSRHFIPHLDQDQISEIQYRGPQDIDEDPEFLNDDDAWLRQWQRSFVNLRAYGTNVA